MCHCSCLIFRGGPFYVSMFLECRCILLFGGQKKRRKPNIMKQELLERSFQETIRGPRREHRKPPVRTTLHPSPDSSSALMGLGCSSPHSVPCIVMVCGCVSLSYKPVRLQKAGHVLLLSIRSVPSTWSSAHQLWLLLECEYMHVFSPSPARLQAIRELGLCPLRLASGIFPTLGSFYGLNCAHPPTPKLIC